jgi:hypothetical protein
MKRSIHSGILVVALLAGIIQTSEAGTWGRSVTIQSARGTVYRRISGNFGGGTVNRYATTTTATGRTFTNKTTFTRTATGRTVSGQYTNGVGGTGYYSGTVSYTPGAITKKQQLTTVSGETYYRNIQTTYGNGSASRTVTTTNPNGTSSTRTVTATQD